MLRVAETIQRTDTGLQRRGNEDSSLARAPMFVVADGMGGARAGEVASSLAVAAFEQGPGEGASTEERLAARVQQANAVIHERSRSEQELAGMGTTLIAAYLEDTNVVLAHVGDSRCYLFRGGTLSRLTQDHSLVSELVRRGKLTEEQAAEHPQRSIITRALGPEASVEVDTFSYPVKAHDIVLLCSDGLTSMISEEQIAWILRAGEPLAAAADRLIADANQAGGRDNITVVLFSVEDTDDEAAAQLPPSAGAHDGMPDPTDQHTVVSPPREARATSSRTAVAERSSGPRLARTQGRPAAPPPAPKRSERFIKSVSALIAIVVVVFLIGGAGYIATRQLYFVGTDSQGVVTLFRGLPYDLPFGVKLYETYYQSGVPALRVPTDRRGALLDHHLRSQGGGTNLVMALEKGQIVK